MKVIASSLRKGNIVEKDGHLYVILTAENIHPGKGTPVTQLDMRRISDGVKVSETGLLSRIRITTISTKIPMAIIS